MHNRVGIYPGTFNPIHVGHISFALESLSTCKLDKVILLPERAPHGKGEVADFDSRVRLVEKMIADHPRLQINILKSMPITWKSEKRELAHLFETNAVTLLLGSDTLKKLKHWQDIVPLLQDHELCVGIRGSDTPESVAKDIYQLEHDLAIQVTYYTVSTHHKDVSSTKIRSQPDYIPL